MMEHENQYNRITPQTTVANAIASNDVLLHQFVASSSLPDILTAWHKIAPLPKTISTKTQLIRFINAQMVFIDTLINEQLNLILHHQNLQNLESSWRGLALIVDNYAPDSKIKIRMLNITWEEIQRDVARLDLDQSDLFKKIYNDEFGTAGGEPFGLLLGDYYVDITGGRSARDLTTLTGMASIAAAAFCPFISSVSAKSFNLDNFAQLSNADSFIAQFKQAEYHRWNNFRKNPDSRFVGLTFPRVILRPPYKKVMLSKNALSFDEDITNPSLKDFLWGNGCMAFGLVALRSFALTGWFGALNGQKDPSEGGGIIEALPQLENYIDNISSDVKYSTEAYITEQEEHIYASLGLIPICLSNDHTHAILYSNNSTHQSSELSEYRYNTSGITAKLSYILCASRFAHYVKIMGRDMIGSLLSAKTIRSRLYNWLRKYLATNEVEDKLRRDYPLQGAEIKVEEIPGKPGAFNCIMYLKPRYQLEKINTSLTLVTELSDIAS